MISWLKRNKVDIGIAIVIFVVALLPRVIDLGMFLTADEKNWIGRSYEFIRAFKDWRFNDMLQTTHPGVTTLWASGLAVTAKMFLSHIPFSFTNLRHFVVAAQLPIALLNALAVPVTYLFLRRLLSGHFIPVLASLFIALNPFLIGYSRVIHVDALLGSLLFLAALTTLLYVKEAYATRWLLASALFSALAILTKIPAVFIIPFLWLAVIVWHGRQRWPKMFLKERVRDFVLWILVIGLLIILIWPALVWVPNQEGNILTVKRDIGQAAITPHHMVEDYDVAAWHYPATLLTRTTPVVLGFGLIALGWLLWLSFRNTETGVRNEELKILWLLVAYVFFFVLMMTLGAKKGDRYILPVFLALDVLAAFGVAAAARVAAQRWQWAERAQYGLAGLALLFLLIPVAAYHPYALAYHNPLFPANLSQELGWGEGLDQVARWLNENAPDAVVASWYPEELGAYTSAQVAHINAHEQGKVGYVVLYKNMFGRAPDHYANDFIDEYYTKRQPVFVVNILDEEFAWVYEKPVYRDVAGEFLPGKVFQKPLAVTHDHLTGIDLLLATYAGRAQVGDLVVIMRAGTRQIQAWRTPVRDIKDDQWLTLRLPGAENLKDTPVTVEVSAEGTSVGNAPTIRSDRTGGLAIRSRYLLSNGKEATEEHTRWLQEE